MTSVIGHLTSLEFNEQYRKWHSCPPVRLFDAPVETEVDKVGRSILDRSRAYVIQDKKAIADNITAQAKYARALFIWTDCDREGEHIGAEVRQSAYKGNRTIEVKRAQFSNTERAYAATFQTTYGPFCADNSVILKPCDQSCSQSY